MFHRVGRLPIERPPRPRVRPLRMRPWPSSTGTSATSGDRDGRREWRGPKLWRIPGIGQAGPAPWARELHFGRHACGRPSTGTFVEHIARATAHEVEPAKRNKPPRRAHAQLERPRRAISAAGNWPSASKARPSKQMHREHLVVLLQGILIEEWPHRHPPGSAPARPRNMTQPRRHPRRIWRTHEQRKTEGTELGAEGVFHGRCGPAVYREGCTLVASRAALAVTFAGLWRR